MDTSIIRNILGKIGASLTAVILLLSTGAYAEEVLETEEDVRAWMHEVNATLAAQGKDFQLSTLEFFTLGQGQ